MANENKNRVKLGIFVTVAIIFITIGVFSIGNKSKLFVSTITIHAEFNDAGGLMGGNNVQFSGVKVGTVKKVTIIAENQVSVEMAVEERLKDFIKKDANAKIGSDGLIGNTIVVITGGSASSPGVDEGDFLVAIQSVDTEDMLATLQKNNENLVGITEQLGVLLEGLNKGEGTLGKLFKDTSLYTNLNQTVDGLDDVRKSSLVVLSEMQTLTKKLNSEDGLVHALFEDESMVVSLKTTLANLEKTANQADAITADVKLLTEKLNQGNNALDLLTNDPEFAESLRSMMQYLESSSVKLDENMKALQSNFFFRGYFKKQDKEAKKADN